MKGPTSRRRRCRRFSILDGMILVAGSALGFALARTVIDRETSYHAMCRWAIPYFLLAMTLAYLPIRWKQPRPPLRRLICQPGVAASVSVMIVALIDAIAWGIFWVKLKPEHAANMVARYGRLSAEHRGPAVLAIWLALALSRRWRAEPGWIDRFGRILGVLWLLTLLTDWEYVRWIEILVGQLRRVNR